MGFEPMRLAPRELESRSLTNSDIFAERQDPLKFAYELDVAVRILGGLFTGSHLKLQDMGFEPMRIAPPRPQRGPLDRLGNLACKVWDSNP